MCNYMKISGTGSFFVKIIKDICYGKDGNHGQYLDIYLPESDSFKAVVYMY